MGKIGKALQTLEIENTPLQRQTGRLVKLFAIIGLAMCSAIVLVFGLTRGDWLKGLLAGLTLGMAMLPEEFPVVLTIFLALGAWRLSKHNVLTRRIPAVETLGATTALCVDKTGTLTLNQMSVADLCVDGEVFEIETQGASLPEKYHPVVEYAILASPSDPFDPMEKAMKDLGQRTLKDTEHLHSEWDLQREYPLSRDLLSMSRVYRSSDRLEFIIAAKGAPEAIADLCHISEAELKSLARHVEILAARGRRVLGIARARFQKDRRLPEGQHDFDFEFLGLLGLADPVRPGVPEAISECKKAGIRVIMITGDYPGTAQSIAREIGIQNASEVIAGPELDRMDEKDLSDRIKNVNLFARMVPEQKLRLVQVLKANGEVVAMTGDGVNDAPALKAAHIGVAMGSRGTDVAREAGSIVLLDDAFESIVWGVRTGRRIFNNLKKAVLYIFVVHVPIAGLSLIPVLLGWPLMLLPIHIVFLELIIDPACTVVFEAEREESGVMNRPPRNLNDSLFGPRSLLVGLVQGITQLAAAIGFIFWALPIHGEQVTRAAVFTSMVLCNLGLILLSRAGKLSLLDTILTPNVPQTWVAMGSIGLLALSLSAPFVQKLFLFASMPIEVLGLALIASFISLGVSNIARRWNLA
jgi:Ca2+-transporting ATPase